MNDRQALSHYGVLGMHWGVTREARAVGKAARKDSIAKSKASPDASKFGSLRRSSIAADKAAKEARNEYVKNAKAKAASDADARKSTDHKEGRILYNKPVSEMSNDEIMKLTRRINLEKQVRDIHPNAYKKGMNVVKGVTAAGTTVAAFYALSQTPLAGKLVQTPLAKSIAAAVAKALAKAALKVG